MGALAPFIRHLSANARSARTGRFCFQLQEQWTDEIGLPDILKFPEFDANLYRA